MKQVLICIFFGVMSSCMFAQPELPAVVALHHPEDYQKNERLAVASMEWLLETALDTLAVKRSRYDVFCMEWLAGHPTVRIETKSALMPYAEKHPQLLYIHCYAAALAQLETENCDRLCYNEAGARAVLKSAGITKGLTQCETLSSMIQAADNNQLKAWVEGRLSP